MSKAFFVVVRGFRSTVVFRAKTLTERNKLLKKRGSNSATAADYVVSRAKKVLGNSAWPKRGIRLEGGIV